MDWITELATGVEVVDDQHKEIIRRVNNLLEACRNENNGVYLEIDNLLDFLADYVMIHFMSEEALQTECSYPEYEQHKKQHEGFTQNFLTMRADYGRKGASMNMQKVINDVVVNWLTNHILKNDVDFAKYYTAKKNNFK